MSDTPFSQWNYSIPDARYSTPRTSASCGESTSNPTHSYSLREPPRFPFPDSQIDPAVVPTAAEFRFSAAAKFWDSAEQRYSINSSCAGSINRSGVRRNGCPRSAEHYRFFHYESSSNGYGRGFVCSAERATDADSRNATALPSPVHSDSSSVALNTGFNSARTQLPKPQRQGSSGIPLGFDKLLHHSPEPSPLPRRVSASSRYHLHIRQQPIAARACGAGDRDRRPLDPPPILQMLLTDFDAQSQADLDTLQDPRLTVGCLLLPVTASSWPDSPETDGASINRDERPLTQRAEENGPGLSTPLLSGKVFVSPFYVDADPDPETAPLHPTTTPDFVETRSNSANSIDSSRSRTPATFFIFPDLSIRTAGVYRLQFRLMNWGLVEDTRQSMPVLAEAWSDPFRVYPAKDFPGMRDSSPLTEALKELGVVELKTRGKGKGKGRRR